ncbi:hypothetical protein X801_10240 [Opisthorchis viverrini]|uniref:Uncharacterized protein n=1 Tax=Opisthorchis viverrini TaxID=6198 RepID=A0A1S8WHR4_OPIVI|nr:hypothetical protein X801_10240 [Opisthorchis viverrini]
MPNDDRNKAWVDRLSMELSKRDKLIQQLSKHLYQLWRANDSLFADYESQETHLTSQLRGLRSRLRDATQTLRQRHSIPRSPSAPPLRTSPIREAVLKFAQDLQTKMMQMDNTILITEYTELRAAVLDLIISWDSIDSIEQGKKCERLFLSALHFVELGITEPASSKPSVLSELEARVRQADQQVVYYSTVVEQLRRELQLAKQLSPQMEVTPFVPHESVRVDLSVYEDVDPVSCSTALRAFASCDPPSTPYSKQSSDVSDISSPVVSPASLDDRSKCAVSIVQPITRLEAGVKLDDYQGLTQQEVLVEEFSYGTTAEDKQSSSTDLRQQLDNLLALKESELWQTTANEQIELEIRALRTACSVLSKVHTTRSVETNLSQLRDAGVQTQEAVLQYQTVISSTIIESPEPGDTHLEQVKTDERFDNVVYRPTPVPDSVERRTDVYKSLEERLIQIVTRLRDLLVVETSHAADSTIIQQMGIESVIYQWESFVDNLHRCLRNPKARDLQPPLTSPCITVVDCASAKAINAEVIQTENHSAVCSTELTDAARKHIRENIWQLRAIHGELTGRVNYCMSWMRDHLNFLTNEIGSLAKKLSNTKHKSVRDAAIDTDQPLSPPVIVEASRFPFLEASTAGRFSSVDRIPVCGDNVSDENACAHRATYRDLQSPRERPSTESVELTSGLHAELLHLRSTQGSLQAQLSAANHEIDALTSYLMRIKVELMESLPKNESSAFSTLLDNLEFQAVPQLVSYYIRWATESLGAYSTQLEHRTTSCVHLQNQLDATQYRLSTMEQNYHCVVSEHTETLKQVDDLRRHFRWESDKRSGFQSGMSDRETDGKLFPSHSVASIFDCGLNEVPPIYPDERATLITPSRSSFNEAIAPEVTLEREPMLQSAHNRVLCSDAGRYVQPVLSHNSPYHPCQIGHRSIFNDDKSLPELSAGTVRPECDSPHVSDIGSSDESGQLDIQRLMLKLRHNEQCLAENRQELQLVAAAKVELEAQVNKLIGDSHTLQAVKKQLQYSEQQKNDLEYRLQKLQELFSEKSSREAGLSDDLQKARSVIESMSGRISDLSVAKEELEATLIQVVTERDQTKNELKQTRSRLNSALAEQDITWQRLNSLTEKVDQQEEMRASLEGQLALNREQLLQKENEIALLRIEFTSLQTKYQQAQHELEHQTVVLSTHVQTLEVRNTNIDKQVGTDELPASSWTEVQAGELEYMRQRIKYLEQTNEQMSRELKDGLDKLSLRLEMSDSRDEKPSDIKRPVLCEKEAAFEHGPYIPLETALVMDCEAAYMKQHFQLPSVEDTLISTATCEDISGPHAAKRQETLAPILDGQFMLSRRKSDQAIITKAEFKRAHSEPTDTKTHPATTKPTMEHANSKLTPLDVHQVCNAWNGYPASDKQDIEAPIDRDSQSVARVTKFTEISTQEQSSSAQADTDANYPELAKDRTTPAPPELLPPQMSFSVNVTRPQILTTDIIRAPLIDNETSESSLVRTQAELSVELRSRGEQIDVLTRLVRDREAALCDVRYVVSSMEAECSRLGDRVFELSSELDRVNGVNRVLSAKCLEFGIECDGVESRLDSRLADALCRIDVLEKEKCQLESQLSSVCPSSMVDVVNSYVCCVPIMDQSVVCGPVSGSLNDCFAIGVDQELSRLRSLQLEWSRVGCSIVGVCDTFLGCDPRDFSVSDLAPHVLESRCSALFDLFRERSVIQCQVENECNLLRGRLSASSDFYNAAARELCNIRSVVDGLFVELQVLKSRFAELLVRINEMDELEVGQMCENLIDSLLLNTRDVSHNDELVPQILPCSYPADTPQLIDGCAEGSPVLISERGDIDSSFATHEVPTIFDRVAMLGKKDVEESVCRSSDIPSEYLSSAQLRSTIRAVQSKECSTQASLNLAVLDRNLWVFKENLTVMKRFVHATLSFTRWACCTLANEIKCHINLSPAHYRSFACELQDLIDHLQQLQSTSTLELTPLDEVEYLEELKVSVENSGKVCARAGSTSLETKLNEPTRKVSTEIATTLGITNVSSMVADNRLASTKTDVLSTFVYALCLLVSKDQSCRIRHLLTRENPSDEFVEVLNGLLHKVEIQLTAMSPSHGNSTEDRFPTAEATTSRRSNFSVEKFSCLQNFLNQLNVFLNNPRLSVCDVTVDEFRSYLDNILMKLNLEAPVTTSHTSPDHLIESAEFAVEQSGNIPLSVTDSSMDPSQSLKKEFQTLLQNVIRCLSELPRRIENMQVQMGYEYSKPKICRPTDLAIPLSDDLSRIPEISELLLILSVLHETLVQFEGHINEYRQRMRSDLISAQEDMKVLEIETVLERLGQEEVSSRLSEMLSHLLHPSTSATTSASAASPPLELKVVDEQTARAPSIDSTTAPTHIKVKSACLSSDNVNHLANNEAYEKEGNQPLSPDRRETICSSTSEKTKDQLVETIRPLFSAGMNVDISTPTPYDPLGIKQITTAQRLHRSHSVPVLRDICFGCVEHNPPEKMYGSARDVKDCENVYANQSARRLHLLQFLNILGAYFPAFLLHSSNYLHSVLGCFLRPSTIRSGLRFLRHLLLVIPDALLQSEPSELAVQLENQLQRTELHLRRRMNCLRGQLVSISRQSLDLGARSSHPDLDQINRELEEVTRGYKCVHDLLPVRLPLHPDGPSCSSLLRLASLGKDLCPAFESILPPRIPLLTNESSSVLHNDLLKRLLHLRDTEVLYLLMLIGHPLPPTESSVKQKLRKFANWNLVTPIDLHTMPVYRVPIDTIDASLSIPGAISTTSIITAKPETDYYSTTFLRSSVSGPDETNETSNAIVPRSSTQLIHRLIQQSREIVENLRIRPDQPCPSSSSVVEGDLYRFEQRLSELIENLQTECLSLRISAQSPGAANPKSAVPSISESSDYPKRAARPPISDLVGAVDLMDDLMELRSLAKHLFDQYNIVSSELEHNLDINWCLRQRLNAANEQIDQISKQMYRGHHSLACMEERLSLETEKHAALTEQCDVTRQQTRKTAHILEGLLEKHENTPSTSAEVRFDSVPSLGHSATVVPGPTLKLTRSTEEIRKRQGLLPVMYTRQITHPRIASTPLKHSVSSQTTKQSKFSCLSLNCAPMRRRSPSDLTPTRKHERLPSHRKRTIADAKSSTTAARRQTDTSATFPLSSTPRDDSRFSLQSNNNALSLSDPSAKPLVTTSHPATMAVDWHKDSSYPAEHILTSSDWSDIGTLETALTQSSTVSIPSTSLNTHFESRLSAVPKKPKKRKPLLGRLFTRKRFKKI